MDAGTERKGASDDILRNEAAAEGVRSWGVPQLQHDETLRTKRKGQAASSVAVAASRFLPSSAHPPASRKHDRIGRVCARGVVFVIACAGVQHVHAKSPHRSRVLSTLSAYFAGSKSPLVLFFLPCVHDAAGHQDANSPSTARPEVAVTSRAPLLCLGHRKEQGNGDPGPFSQTNQSRNVRSNKSGGREADRQLTNLEL